MQFGRFDDVVEYTQRFEFAPGPDKVTNLRAAVAEHIRPGMAIHTGITHAFPYALCAEITRRFHGTRPDFTIYSIGAVNHVVIWVLEGLVKKLVSSYCGDVYPAPGPNPAFNDAYVSGEVEFENWSVLTYSLRMLAGAMGWPFVPTRSILGSSMESDNAALVRVLDDPESGRVALLKPARPDISLYHAWAADRSGNAIFAPPYAENVWGAMASRGGALLTCERIVDTAFIRRHSAFARLPGRYVKAVVHTPMGAHPGGFFPAGIEGVESYAEDYDFIVDFRTANRKPETFGPWLHEWVLSVPDHEGYLKKLGADRIAMLKARSAPDYWRRDLEAFEKDLSDSPECNGAEFMTVAAAREIARRVRAGGHSMILAGQGSSNLAAWLAFYALREGGVPCELVAETGFYGYSPRPASPFLFNFYNIPACTTLTDAMQTLGVFVGGSEASCIGSLSAGQVDRLGNLNSTCIPRAYYLVGSGGANDVASSARELVVTVPLSPMRYLEQVPYITAPGRAVAAIVSEECILRRGPNGAFRIEALLGDRGAAEDRVRGIREKCGFDLAAAPELDFEPAPALRDLKLLRSFDPRRAFLR
jgi:acyl CoA:acetate/3-ketoacid CoA transferase alpha subunit